MNNNIAIDTLKNSLYGRIRLIRELGGFSRDEFARLTGIPRRTIEGIENEGRLPRGDVLEKISRCFPQYACWLVLGKNLVSENLSPLDEIERAKSLLLGSGYEVSVRSEKRN